MTDPWADPATPTQAGPTYPGPPPTAPPHGYGPPPFGYGSDYGPPPFGYGSGYGLPPQGYGSGYGLPPQGYGYGPPPSSYAAPYAPWPPGPASPWAAGGPERPGQVIAGGVLAFVQAIVVLVASLYLWFFASVADLAASGAMRGGYSSAVVSSLATEGSTLAAVQLASVVLLVAGGVLALNRRTRAARLWLLAAHAVQVLLAVYWAARLLILLDDIPGDDPQAPFLVVAMFFATGPAVALGLLLTGPGRRWFDGTPRA